MDLNLLLVEFNEDEIEEHLIEPYKQVHKKEKVTLQTGSEALASTISTQTEPQVIEVKKRKKLISDEDLDEKQGIIEFDVVSASGSETESWMNIHSQHPLDISCTSPRRHTRERHFRRRTKGKLRTL